MTRGEKFAIESLICQEGSSAIMTYGLAEEVQLEKDGGWEEPDAKQMIPDMCTCGLVYNLYLRPIGITVGCDNCLEIRGLDRWNMGKSRFFSTGSLFRHGS